MFIGDYMNEIHMTIKEARDFMVGYHKINTKNQPVGKQGVLEVFDNIKSIQYDPLNVVGRNSDLVLQSRVKKYKESYLNDLLYKDRVLVDGWDKQMCIFQTSDLPYFSRVREDRGHAEIGYLTDRLKLNVLDYVEDILDHIKQHGPSFSTSITFGDIQKNKWGHSKPSSGTLDYLFHTGVIGIRSKKNTSKEYDLIENLLPSYNLIDEPFESLEEFGRWYILRRIASMGLVSSKSGVMWSTFYISSKSNRMKLIRSLCDEGLITKVYVEGLNEELYCLSESLKEVNEIQKKISFIAPLDNLIWDRNLIEKLFDFKYRWEVYTPIVKREYGYYVLPILYGSDFIGRIEFEMHRNNDNLAVKKIWWENDKMPTAAVQKKLDTALKAFHEYLMK